MLASALWPELAGLFLVSFLAATLLPGGSEIALAAFMQQYPDAWWPALVIATIGNTGGGMTSYLIGRLLPNRRVPGRALHYAQRYGCVTLLFAWLPVIGDALCVAAGWLRFNPWASAVLMAVGKFVRYAAVAGGWRWLVGNP
jgi:membrane protein YqaA with SNARE-associated domain